MNSFTREQYLAGDCSHREYWAQFVTPSMKAMVLNNIGLARLQRSKDKYFSDVTTLADWDCMRNATFHMLNMVKWREIQYPEYAGLTSVGWSLSDNVCLLKEAARQLVEEHQANEIWQSYDGICPDCGEDISTEVSAGEECHNCGHVFHPAQATDD